MPEWAQAVVAGGSLLGFWAWARACITKCQARLAAVGAEVEMIKTRCHDHREDIGKVFDRIGEVAESVARIEGILSTG